MHDQCIKKVYFVVVIVVFYLEIVIWKKHSAEKQKGVEIKWILLWNDTVQKQQTQTIHLLTSLF